MFLGCSTFKTNQLYIDNSIPDTTNTFYYTSAEIYHDYLSSEAWYTLQDHCIMIKPKEEASYDGETGLHVKWDRQAEGCPWLGLGFGWDSWTGKDLSSIKNTAAIEFWVRMLDGERVDLPWAIGLEDFTGAQAWLGMSRNAVKADNITTEWTRIELPLSEFNWNEQNADIGSIKQIIFNMEGEGEIFMDEIRIVPYEGGYRKRVDIFSLIPSQFEVDGQKGDVIWETQALQFGSNQIHMAIIDSFLCVAMEVKDLDPLENSFSGSEIYNGDAFEIAFSTDPSAPLQRTRYLSSDQHIGFALSDEISTWNWRTKSELKKTISKAKKTATGYIFECKININELNAKPFSIGELYGLELAVDHGDLNGRVRQERWNDPTNPGFFDNPFKWGEMLFLQPMAWIQEYKIKTVE